MASSYMTPVSGFSTPPSTSQLRLERELESSKRGGEKDKEIEKAKAYLADLEKEYLLQHVISNDQEKKRKLTKEKYSNLSKEIQETNWMYPLVDDILCNKTKRKT